MYQRRNRKRKTPQGAPEVQRAQAPTPPAIDNSPGMMEQVGQMAAGKVANDVAGAGMDMAKESLGPLAKDGMAAMKGMASNSGAATTAMTSGVDAGIANAMAGAAPTASGQMAAGAGAMGNMATNMGAALGGAGSAGAGAAGAAGAGAAGAGAAGAGAAGGALMAGLGTAMPWIGAGLLAGKAFGLFSDGGLVGPLAGMKYKSNGQDSSDEFSVNFQKKGPNA